MIETPTLEKQAPVTPVVEAATPSAENLNPDQLKKAQEQLASSLKSLMDVNVPSSLEAQYQNTLQGFGQVLEKLNQMVRDAAPAEPQPIETPAPVKTEPARQKTSPFAQVRQLFRRRNAGQKSTVDVRTAPTSLGENQGVAGSASPEPFGYDKGKDEWAEENAVLNKKLPGEATTPTPPAEPVAEPLLPHQEVTQPALRTGQFDVSTLRPVTAEPSKPAEPQSEVPPTALMPAVEAPVNPEQVKPEVTHSYEISKSEDLTIGRNPASKVLLTENYVSINHAKISLGNFGPTIVDLGSSNGTFINGEKLVADPDKLRRLENEDKVSLGSTGEVVFLVRREGDKWFLDKLKPSLR